MNTLIAVRKEGVTRLTTPATIINGFPNFQGSYLISKQACSVDGVDPKTLNRTPPTPQTEKYYLRMGLNPDGNEVVDLSVEESQKREQAERALAEKWSRVPKTGNNKYPGGCERCGEYLPPGYGSLQFCAADTGCVQHMDKDGYHLRCAEESFCDERVKNLKHIKSEYRLSRFELFLSGRGWGDGTPVVWTGDIRRPTDEIAKECRCLLDKSNDLDNPLTDEQLIVKIKATKATWIADLG